MRSERALTLRHPTIVCTARSSVLFSPFRTTHAAPLRSLARTAPPPAAGAPPSRPARRSSSRPRGSSTARSRPAPPCLPLDPSSLPSANRGREVPLRAYSLEGMGDRERRVVFVTVGTTCFDALVKVVDSEELKQALLQKGYTDLLIQMGRGTYKPSKASGNSSLQVEHFTFSPSIADNIREASLVISHAGSGSIFETLRLGKPLIVVVNEDLMDNHQSELAEELAERNHLFCAHPHTLRETVEAMDLKTLQPYVPGEAKPVVALINRFLGFPVD
ncbi:UDP-N-acetylglucosamine transferase subunit ALG13 homolog [Triticum urartu]|nr:UDP-N-acetylglucosamine transferase subunit ALG13 homolog [Triticum urartu]